jgi:hypothetical protein
MEAPVGSGTVDTTKYIFNPTAMTLVISCNLCLTNGTLEILKLTGTQGTSSNFIQFTVTFLSDCSTATAIAPVPSLISVSVKVSDPILIIPITGFRSSI